jgi:polyisoprenoid-binding protein YceI
MKKTLVFFAIALSFGFAQADKYKIDQAHSSVEFKIRHLLSKTSGKFKEFEGDFTFDEAKSSDASGKMTIKVKSIDTNNAKRDEHLKSPDFFDADKFDTITFVSKKFKKIKGMKYKLEGDMTMKGVTKPVAFDVEYQGLIAKDPFGMKRVTFNAVTKISRKEFGMDWNKPMEESLADKAKKAMSKTMIGDEVEVSINIEATAI